MRFYLDPVGGVAGDMFAAAVLDAFPDLWGELESALARTDLGDIVTVGREAFGDGTLTGTRFTTAPARSGHAHRSHASIVAWLESANLEGGVRRRALDIFAALARAEATVHAIPLADVTFHEVGAWDSIADVVTAAWLIEALAPAQWHCAPLPMGRGRVETAHGRLPVPAPATSLLLAGFPLTQDDAEGERVTPTGAAIVRHLDPSFAPLGDAGRLHASGTGFGTRRLPGMSNVLRLLCFEPTASAGEPAGWREERVALCAFEVDDQPPEDLALGLERVRESPGVLEVVQIPILGKKGRMAVQVQVLTRPEARADVLETVFAETTTLGVRWQTMARAALERQTTSVDVDGARLRVKRARRPRGLVTAKAESDDLASTAGFEERQKRRARAEATAAGCGWDAER